MNRSLFYSFFSFFIIMILIPIFFIPVYVSYPEMMNPNLSIPVDPNVEYLWPIPASTTITSRFGKRTSPTAGASTFHKGVDIAAPEGTPLYAVCDGEITFANFLGGGGYTITLSTGNMKITYCHVSPTFFVSVGDKVSKGDFIAKVGPKNVYGVPNNPYKDKNGEPTNGATTGCHLHLGVRVDEQYINPLSLFPDMNI